MKEKVGRDFGKGGSRLRNPSRNAFYITLETAAASVQDFTEFLHAVQ